MTKLKTWSQVNNIHRKYPLTWNGMTKGDNLIQMLQSDSTWQVTRNNGEYVDPKEWRDKRNGIQMMVDNT